nr:putative ribonuclease H-like domain-containing protein [Tanacetum cinerariifolium]
MIGSLMYLTSLRPDIMFDVCADARFQVTPKVSHLHAVKRIFRYLKSQPKLGFWYPKDSPFDLEAYTDSEYDDASLNRKSTTRGCQFVRSRLISWQCNKQTMVANSTIEAEYVAAASCCGQVLWIQNQILDYGYNFRNTKIFIDNESTICIVKNLVFHSKTKHIEIQHHFIGDSNKKKLIQMIKIHAYQNVKTINGGEQIQALVDKKKVIIIGTSVRSDLHLEDAEGTERLPTATIFKQLTLIGYENLTQKLTFYKAFFSPQMFVRDPNKTPDLSQRPPYNCLKCGNPVDGLYCRQCALLRKNLKESQPPQFPVIHQPPQEETSVEILHDHENNRPAFNNYDNDDDEDYTIAITPVLSTEESVDSVIIEDEHLDTISTMKSDEVIKSSVEDLVPIPSESEGIPDNMCDVPFSDNSPHLDISKDQFKDFSDFNDDSTLIDDDYFSIDDVDYVEASSPNSELIESLNDNPTPDRVLKSPSLFHIPVEDGDSFFDKSDTSLSYSDNSLPEFKTFSDYTEETSSGSTTTHADYSLPEYDSFIFEIEPDQGELTSVVMEDNLGEPRVHVPNVLPTHPTLMLDSNFIPFHDSLRSDLKDCPDFEDSYSWFCPLITRSLHPQLHFRNSIS